MNNNLGPTMVIGAILLATLAAAILLAYMGITSIEYNTNTSPDQFPRAWAELNRGQLTQKMAEWLITQDPSLQQLGREWVTLEVENSLTWQHRQVRPWTHDTNRASALAIIQLTTPSMAPPQQQTEITARIPWRLYLKPDARTVHTRDQDDMVIRRHVRDVVAAPMWNQATILRMNQP